MSHDGDGDGGGDEGRAVATGIIERRGKNAFLLQTGTAGHGHHATFTIHRQTFGLEESANHGCFRQVSGGGSGGGKTGNS